MSISSDINNTVKNFRIVYVLFVLLGICAITKIISVQYFDKDVVEEKDIYRTEVLEAARGSILSADGRPLSTSTPYYQIRMDCSVPHDTVFYNEVDELALNLSQLFKNKSKAAYKKELLEARKKGNKYKLLGNRSVDFVELKELKSFPILELGQFRGGLIVIQKNRRANPYGRLAYRTIGYINEVGTGVGIEGSYDYILRGTEGEQTTTRQLGGEWTPVPGEKYIPAKDGSDIKTTLDIDIQEAAENALKKQLAKSDLLEGGTTIVMDVETGAIRAIVNMKKTSNGGYDESYNYAIRDATEPGSTMKLATLICLLEDGKTTLNSIIDCESGEWRYAGTRFSDVRSGGYGEITVKEAFENSSNIAFAKLAIDAYEEDESSYVARLHNLKINEYFNLDISGEGRALIYEPSDAAWSKVSLPMMGIGYGLLLTPLHMLTFYNAVANDGKMMKPYFVDSFIQGGIVTEQFQPQVLSGSICSKSTIKEVKKALRGVVENGTSKRFNSDNYQFSGKTGTAQIATNGRYIDAYGYRKHQASFAGFFPSDNPKYTCIVVLYSNKTRGNFYGGTWATPVFKEIADKVYASHPEWNKVINPKNVKPIDNPSIASGSTKDLNQLAQHIPMKNKPQVNKSGWCKLENDSEDEITIEQLTIQKGLTPDVTTMGLKDAIYLLENEGYKVRFSGKGRVIEQHPEAGSSIKEGTVITIKLAEQG